MKSALMGIALCLFFSVAVSADARPAEDDEAVYDSFVKFATSTYYNNILGENSKEYYERIEKWKSDANNNAALFGYILYNLKQYEKNWSDEHDRLFLMIKRKLENEISGTCASIARKKGWGEVERYAYEAEALFSFNETFNGNARRIQDMIALTGVRPGDAPDFFVQYGAYLPREDETRGLQSAPDLAGDYDGGKVFITRLGDKYRGFEKTNDDNVQLLLEINTLPEYNENGTIRYWLGRYRYRDKYHPDRGETWVECMVTFGKIHGSDSSIIWIRHQYGSESLLRKTPGN